MTLVLVCVIIVFLSTLSLRRATCFSVPNRLKVAISIHALLAESDNTSMAGRMTENDFYPRSPCGERLDDQLFHLADGVISIHALLAESDRERSK